MPTPGNAYRQFTGVVVSAGKMMRTVKVRIPGQKWDKHIRKVGHLYAPLPLQFLVLTAH